MYTDLEGKTALVTGSGKRTGIGYAIAAKLAACGCRIIITDLGGQEDSGSDVKTGTNDEMNDIADALGKQFGVATMATALDITDGASVRAAAEAVKEKFGTVHVLCNNAGATFGVPNTVQNYDEGAWMKTIDANLHGTFRVSRAILPLMEKNGGSIVNTASRAGKVPPLFNGAYAVAKAGVIMLSKVMAKELAGQGIRVNAICPGQIMTDLEKWRFDLQAKFLGTTAEEQERQMCETIPLGRIGTPAEAADLAVFLASGAASYITGQAFNITGGQLMEL